MHSSPIESQRLAVWFQRQRQLAATQVVLVVDDEVLVVNVTVVKVTVVPVPVLVLGVVLFTSQAEQRQSMPVILPWPLPKTSAQVYVQPSAPTNVLAPPAGALHGAFAP